MTRTELIETLGNYFHVSTNEDDVVTSWDWTSGCSMGDIDTPWLTLANVVDALECLCDDEDDDYYDEDDED